MKKFNKDIRAETKVFAVLTAVTLASVFGAASGALAAGPDSHWQSVYVAHLHPMNSKVTGLQTTGEARFSVVGDQLTISVKADGLPPNLVHWQHFHGFADNRAATCPASVARPSPYLGQPVAGHRRPRAVGAASQARR